MIPAMETKEPGPSGKKRRQIHCALDAGGVVTIVAIASLDRLQARSIWQMSAEGRCPLAIIRETLLHENTVEGISFRPTTGKVPAARRR